jgi:uncharacterized membrane protein YccF (DUF307 family)
VFNAVAEFIATEFIRKEFNEIARLRGRNRVRLGAMRLLWLPIGLPLSIGLNVLGVLFCLTIVGIPVGLTCFALANRMLLLR